MTITGERFVNRGVVDVNQLTSTLTDAFVADGLIFCNAKDSTSPQGDSFAGDIKRIVIRGVIQAFSPLNMKAHESIVLMEKSVVIAPSVSVESPRVNSKGIFRQPLTAPGQDQDDALLWGKVSIGTKNCTLGSDLSLDSLYIKALDTVDIGADITARDGTIEVPRGVITVQPGVEVHFTTSSLKNDNYCSVGMHAKELVNKGKVIVKDAWCPSITERLHNHDELRTDLGFDLDTNDMILNNTGVITAQFIKARTDSLIGDGTLQSTASGGLGLHLSMKNQVEIAKMIALANVYIASKNGNIALSDADIKGKLALRGAPGGVHLSGNNAIGRIRATEGALEGSVTIDGQLTLNNRHDSAASTKLECNGAFKLSDQAGLNVFGDITLNPAQDMEIAGTILHEGNNSLHLLTPGVMTFVRSPDKKERVEGSLEPRTIRSSGLVVLSASLVHGQMTMKARDGEVWGVSGIRLEGFIGTDETLKAICEGPFFAESLEIGGDCYVEARNVTVGSTEHIGGHYLVITNTYNNPSDHAVGGTLSLVDPRRDATLFGHLIEPGQGLVFDKSRIHTAPNEAIIFFGDYVILNKNMDLRNWQSETYGKGFECHNSLIKSTNGLDHLGGSILIGCALETPGTIKFGGEELLITQEFEWMYNRDECQKRGLPCCHVSHHEPLDADRCGAGDSLNVRPLWNDRPKWTERGAMQVRKALDNSGILKADTLLIDDVAQDITLRGATIDVQQLDVAGKKGMKLFPVLALARAFHKERSTCKKGKCVTRDFYTAYSVTSIVPSTIQVHGNCSIILQKGNFELVDSDVTVNGLLAMDMQNGGLHVQDQTYPSAYGWRCPGAHYCQDGVCADGKQYCEDGTFVEMKNQKRGLQGTLAVGADANITLSKNFTFWGGSAEFFANLNLTTHGNFLVKPIEIHNNLGVGGHQGAGLQRIGFDSIASITDGSESAVSTKEFYEGPGQGIAFFGGNIRVHGNGYVDVRGSTDVSGGTFVVDKNLTLRSGNGLSVGALIRLYLDAYDQWKRGHSWSITGTVKPGVIASGENAGITVTGDLDCEGGVILAGNVLNTTVDSDDALNLRSATALLESYYKNTKKKLFSKSTEVLHGKQQMLFPFMVVGKNGTYLNSRNGTIHIGFGELGADKTPTEVEAKNVEILPDAQKSEIYYQIKTKGLKLFGLGGAFEGGPMLQNVLNSLPAVREVKMLQGARKGEKAGAALAVADAVTHLWANPLSAFHSVASLGLGYGKVEVEGAGSRYDPRSPSLLGNVLIKGKTVTLSGNFEDANSFKVRASEITVEPVETVTRHHHKETRSRVGVSVGTGGVDCTWASQTSREFGYMIKRSPTVIVSQSGVAVTAKYLEGVPLIDSCTVEMDVDELDWQPAVSELHRTTTVEGSSVGLGLGTVHGGLTDHRVTMESIKVDSGGVINAQEFLATGKNWHLRGTNINARQGYLNVTRLVAENPEEFERVIEDRRSLQASISPSFTWNNMRNLIARTAISLGKRFDEAVVSVLATIAPGISINEQETDAAQSINRDSEHSRSVLRQTSRGTLYYAPIATPAAIKAHVDGVRQTNKRIATLLREKLGANKKELLHDHQDNNSAVDTIEAMIDENAHAFAQEEVEALYESAESRFKNGQENVVKQEGGVWVIDLDESPNEQMLAGEVPDRPNDILIVPRYDRLADHVIQVDSQSIQTLKEGEKVVDCRYMITFKSNIAPEQIMRGIKQNWMDIFNRGRGEKPLFGHGPGGSYERQLLNEVSKGVSVIGGTSTSTTLALDKGKAGLITLSVNRIDSMTTFVIHSTLRRDDEYEPINSKLQKGLWIKFCLNVAEMYGTMSMLPEQNPVEIRRAILSKEAERTPEIERVTTLPKVGDA